MKAKKVLSIILAVILLVSVLLTTAAADFTDVPSDHPYYEAINFSQSLGYVTGATASIFKPDASISRAQMAVVLCRAELFQSLAFDVNKGNFTDIVPLKHYYDTAVIILNSLGIMTGTSATKFSPDNDITREQIAVIIKRTLNLGAANANDYQRYADHASISEWARDAVSSCINADVFAGLYEAETFEPKKPATRGEICKLIYNISKPLHTVSIAPMTGGTVEAHPSRARTGRTITLTVTPEANKRLKAGTLKYNGLDVSTSYTFAMPDEDVLITAEFEDIPRELTSIEITQPPTKTSYEVGEGFDLSGLIVSANYNIEQNVEITGYTTDPAANHVFETAGTVTVTVSYTEGEITKTATFDVTVTENPG